MVIVSLERFNELIVKPLYLERLNSTRAAELLESFHALPVHRPDISAPGLDLSHPFVAIFLPDCLDLLRAYSDDNPSRVEELHPIVREHRLHYIKLINPTIRVSRTCYGVYRNVFNS